MADPSHSHLISTGTLSGSLKREAMNSCLVLMNRVTSVVVNSPGRIPWMKGVPTSFMMGPIYGNPPAYTIPEINPGGRWVQISHPTAAN